MRSSCRSPLAPFQPAPPARRATFVLVRGLAVLRVFQPAPPARRATVGADPPRGDPLISTRAPRTEGDPRTSRRARTASNFNPRPPHGGRRPEDGPEER